MNFLREKINGDEMLRGTLVSLSDPCLCEIMGNAGFDCVWIDHEHSYISFKEVLSHLNACRAAGVASVVRLPQNDLTATKKILEMGPDGIIFPMVRTFEEAELLIEMTLYPPYGTRGFGPMRAIGYDPSKSPDYVEHESLSLCRFMQIESVSMIDELDKIAANPFIDGFIFGPNDLSGSVGEMLNVRGEKTVIEIRRAVEIAKRHGKKIGLAGGCSVEVIEYWKSFGLDMLFVGGDWVFLFEKAVEVLKLL